MRDRNETAINKEVTMKYAIATDGGSVSAHFGRCPEFTIIDVENNQVKEQTTVPNPGHHPGFLPEFLAKQGVRTIIAGGMGPRAHELFAEKNIQTIVGVAGSVDSVVAQLKEGTLKGGPTLCEPGAGKGYGVEKTECSHGEEQHHE
jgi:predicted Fe-Mo cluster-binding NifX family protein